MSISCFHIGSAFICSQLKRNNKYQILTSLTFSDAINIVCSLITWRYMHTMAGISLIMVLSVIGILSQNKLVLGRKRCVQYQSKLLIWIQIRNAKPYWNISLDIKSNICKNNFLYPAYKIKWLLYSDGAGWITLEYWLCFYDSFLSFLTWLFFLLFLIKRQIMPMN